ncbi:unnamed protein product [Timema podura]|uniref:Ribosomal protein L36 n=1 Tax=Timema podura TaxID=61482 RepID=A0ABN7PLV8_TIMPD|nr:unnamed protein product [Timema podura]
MKRNILGKASTNTMKTRVRCIA